MAYKDEVYWIERDKIGIANLNRTATSISREYTGPSGGISVTVFAVLNDSNFGDTDSVTGKIGPTESPSIPEEFHKAIAYGVFDKLYSQNPTTIQVATYWNSRFNASIMQAKQYANTGRDGAAPKIKPAEY